MFGDAAVKYALCICAALCGSGVHAPQHFLYFLPLPQGHGSFLPIFGVALLKDFSCLHGFCQGLDPSPLSYGHKRHRVAKCFPLAAMTKHT
jgi:hypothetical protein